MTLSTCHFFERIYKVATPVVRVVRNGPDLIIEVGGGARGDGGYISPEAAGGMEDGYRSRRRVDDTYGLAYACKIG